MRNTESQKTNHQRELIVQLGIVLFYLSVAAVLIILCSQQETNEAGHGNRDIWEIIWDSITGVVSIVIAVVDFASAIYLSKRRVVPQFMAISIALALYLIFVFNNVAIKYPLSRALIVIVNSVAIIICLCLCLIRTASQEDKQGALSKTDRDIEKTLRKTDNRRIIAIQMYNIQVSHYSIDNVERVRYIVKAGESFIRNGYDINTVSAITYEIDRVIADSFYTIIRSYQRFLCTGDETAKVWLICSIDEQIVLLKDKLSELQVSKRSVTKEDCCLARILIMYLSLISILNPTPSDSNLRADYIGEISLKEGDLCIDRSIEKQLFTFIRTGLFGAALLDERMRHVFAYRKDGTKQGRKYCASVLGSVQTNDTDDVCIDRHIDVCLFTIDEKSCNAIPGYVLASIERRESQIIRALYKGETEDKA